MNRHLRQDQTIAQILIDAFLIYLWGGFDQICMFDELLVVFWELDKTELLLLAVSRAGFLIEVLLFHLYYFIFQIWISQHRAIFSIKEEYFNFFIKKLYVLYHKEALCSLS